SGWNPRTLPDRRPPGGGSYEPPRVRQEERTTLDPKSMPWRFLAREDLKRPLRIEPARGLRSFLENPRSLVRLEDCPVETTSNGKAISLTADHPTLVYPHPAGAHDNHPLNVSVLPERHFLTSDEVNGIETRDPSGQYASERDRIPL